MEIFMENKYDISVIIPCYNVENYIAETMDSLINQNYENYEIICINDGSTDLTQDILRKYEAHNKNIRVISQQNCGIGQSRNTGIKAAQGKYLFYVDGDDLVEEDCLKVLFHQMENNNLDIIYFSAESFYDSSELEEMYSEFKNIYRHKTEENRIYTGKEIFEKFREDEDYIVSPSLQMIRREFLKESDILFPDMRIHEDNIYTFQTMIHAKRCMCLDQVLYRRRVRPNSLMTSKKQMERLQAYDLIIRDSLKEYVECWNDAVLKKAIYKHIRGHFKNVYKILNSLDEEEREEVLKNDNDCKWILMAMSMYTESEEEERHKLNSKLKIVYAEKSEINAKLQKTYAEKSEINAKLQKTYAEKAERGILIKEYEKRIRELERGIKK